MDPGSQIVLAGSIIQTSEAAVRLTDTLLGRLTVRRVVGDAEKQALRYWIAVELQKCRDRAQVVLNESGLQSLCTIWEDYERATRRTPAADHVLAALRDQHAQAVFRGRTTL